MHILCSPYSGSLSLRLRIFSLTSHVHTNSQAHSSIGTTSGFNALRLFVSMWFQNLFTPLPGFFSPFPHGTASLSVVELYLALRGGPRVFDQDYSCPDLLWIQLITSMLRIQVSHLLWNGIPSISSHIDFTHRRPKPQITLV